MKKFLFIFCFALLTGIVLLITCKKEDHDASNQVVFSVNVAGSKSHLKSVELSSLSSAKKAIVTITYENGNATRYTDYSLDLFNMNGQFFTGSVVLKTGNYKLTMFVLADSSDNVIFAAPLTGSPEAQNVNQPLPLTFHIMPNSSQPVNVQVISTEGRTPESFGLSSFTISTVPTFSIMVGVFNQDSNKFIPATLTVRSNSTYAYVQQLEPVANNIVTLKDGFSDYVLTIESPGFAACALYFSNDSMKVFCPGGSNLPLIIKAEIQVLGTVTDNEGNVYSTITIGKQTWMTENLRTTHYNNGNPILKYIDPSACVQSLPDKRCYFDGPCAIYGKYYTWYAITDPQDVCPTGWHIPSYTEWETLINYAGGASSAALKLKVQNYASCGWAWGYQSNSLGFSAYPGGWKIDCNVVDGYTFVASFWTSTTNPLMTTQANSVSMIWNQNNVSKTNNYKYEALTVRCVKN